MAINWFEGGRRITHLFMAVTVLGGAGYVGFANEPAVYFTTQTPNMPWIFTTDQCPYPSVDHYVDSMEIKPGQLRSVRLCFEANDQGKIFYAAAPTPAGPPPIVQTRAHNDTGAPPVFIPVQQYFYMLDGYDSRVTEYVAARSAAFRLTPQLREQARGGLTSLWWSNKWRHFSEAWPWVAGIVVGLWLITTVIGWIIRGFAGIRGGRDFRDSQTAPRVE